LVDYWPTQFMVDFTLAANQEIEQLILAESALVGIGNSFVNTIRGADGADRLSGLDGDDRLAGRSGSDSLYGDGGDDRLYGASGDDVAFGGSGVDTLFGSAGSDGLYGGSGQDQFNFDAEAANDQEVVYGFYGAVSGEMDRIRFDVGGNAGAWVGAATFSGSGDAEARVAFNASGAALIELDANGDAVTDLEVELRNVDSLGLLTSSDFIFV